MIDCDDNFLVQYYVELALYYIEEIAEESHDMIDFN
jgi:hypothetical protein